MSLDNAKAPKKSLKLSNKNKDELLDFIINSKIINLKDSLISNKCDDDTESTLILAFENKSYTYEEYCTNNDIYNKVESKIRSIVGKENILDYENSIKEFYNEEYFRNKNYATRN